MTCALIGTSLELAARAPAQNLDEVASDECVLVDMI